MSGLLIQTGNRRRGYERSVSYDLQGCRTVYGLESDAVGLIAARAAWFDVIKFEVFPVYPIGETKKMLRK